MPQYANTNWHNAHNFYGDLKDLEAATLEDVQKFFDTYYAPNNAVLVVVGDFEEKEARQMIEKYFGSIPASKQPITFPDLAEPRQEKEKRATKQDPLAPRPALAFSYHMPPRGTPEYYAMGVLDQLLVQGEDSLLWQELVKRRAYAGGVSGGANVLLGNLYNYQGPMLWTAFLFHDRATPADQILTAVDGVIKEVQDKPVTQAQIDRALVKVRSQLYNILGQLNGFGRADLLASFALFDDDPSRINQIEANFRKVTPELLQKTAREYLRTTNRTVLTVEPKAAPTPAAAPSSPSK
jgi:predicted Zn-dependent peptidase